MTHGIIRRIVLGAALTGCCAEPGLCGGAAAPVIDANISLICRSKALDPRALSLCVSYLHDVYYLDRSFGGWLGRIQAALRADIRGLNVENFPFIRFSERLPRGDSMPSGDSGAWEGSVLGLDEGEVTLSEMIAADDPAAKVLLDHEFCHHADAGHWDGSPSGQNPYGGSEKACYAVEGCLVTGNCQDPR